MPRIRLFVVIALILIQPLSVQAISFENGSDDGSGELDGITPAKQITAFRLTESIVLDGRLTELAWQRPAAAPMIQNDPDNGRRPRQRTDWWVAYDKDALYLAARLHDSAPDSICCDIGRRDTWPNSDWLYLNLNTFDDDRNGYSFSLSPAGAIGDAVLYNDGWDDASWDGIWDFGVKIDHLGWVAEIRIPFSQLNFPNQEEQVWGINVSRRTRRYRERDELFHLPLNESGYFRRFPKLVGIRGIEAGNRLEVLAYGAGKAEQLQFEAGDPFHDDVEASANAGVDLQWGVSSNLTLKATVNPDFGQVEVDPAVVNLSDFETYFPEKRPFFVKDANIFRYGSEGTNNNWNFNWMDPMLFYSRRIGRSPQLSLDEHDYADVPDASTILGAAKLSGTMGETSVGFLNAITAEESALLQSAGSRSKQLLEPLTNYTVLRAKRASGDGNRGLGAMITNTWRDLSTESSRNELVRHGQSGGLDGWLNLDSNAVWALRGYIAGSHITGSESAIADIQNSYVHYMNRPDMDHVDFDPTRTSFSGWTARTMLNKQSGSVRLNTALGVVSPGFHINDMGFQTRADKINYHLATGYRWSEPGKLFRNAGFDLAGYQIWNFGGVPGQKGLGMFYNGCFLNYWAFWGRAFFNPETNSLDSTRGGPIMRTSKAYSFDFHLDSDGRKTVYIAAGGDVSSAENGSRSAGGDVSLVVRPRSSLKLSFSPRLSWSDDKTQWVDSVSDDAMNATYGQRYIYSDLEYRQFSLTTRIDWTITPKFTLQTYIQPLFVVARYTGFKELAQAATNQFNEYGEENSSTIEYDAEGNSYQIDPDGDGTAESFDLDNPDFNFKSLKINAVLRWEYRPGSTAYLVWTQGRVDYADPGDFSLSRDSRSLMDADSENIVMLKITRWFDI
jgi:Domain of unknown function (DUF5916)